MTHHHQQTRLLNRRNLLISSAGFLAAPAFAAVEDRATTRGGKQGSRIKLSCDNSAVPISDMRHRVSEIGDFDAAGKCNVFRDSFEGPYFMCVGNKGKEIAVGQDGQPLIMALRVMDGMCQPIPNAVVDVWACDAHGVYSGYNASPDLPVSSGAHQVPENTDRQCRGVLRTDAEGVAEFDTIYPGFYSGRAIHVHFKIHQKGRSFVVNQALLPEAINTQVMDLAPYNKPRPISRVPNARERGFEEFSITTRGNRLVATLNVGIPNT